ncbi:DUF6155 family protein [Christiangramia sabulilitoris]|uniref:Uncharacterized protein n=1 Tax=Christiangramia sabulilitoris TaxID=2583991 RepID=A0A550I6E1_9FLAO|nr:DUF6155 family protein [Christiangramia sabulilitoris]TRO66537.1 hypothetical protein FGM01_01250 [Christiangramia sabulilitoris]
MSKRAFKKYINSLPKKELEEQILDLYERFPEVKTFYNFVFNPNEEKLVREAKFKISKEYFPPNNRRPKARRSVAHKLIKHFLKLEMEAHALADVMLYNIEVAQTYSRDRENISEGFQKSMLKSFEQVVNFVIDKGISNEFVKRIYQIGEEAEDQKWVNTYQFEQLKDRFL